MRTQIEYFRTKYCDIWLDEDGILWLKPDAETELDFEEVKSCFDTLKKWVFIKTIKCFKSLMQE